MSCHHAIWQIRKLRLSASLGIENGGLCWILTQP